MSTWTVLLNRSGVLLENNGLLFRVRDSSSQMCATGDYGQAWRVFRSAVQRACGA